MSVALPFHQTSLLWRPSINSCQAASMPFIKNTATSFVQYTRRTSWWGGHCLAKCVGLHEASPSFVHFHRTSSCSSLILTLLFATFWSHEDLLLPKETYRSRSCPRAQQVWAGFRVGLGWKFDRTSVSCTGFVKQVRDSSISRQRGHPWLPTQPREKERKKEKRLSFLRGSKLWFWHYSWVNVL
jgi:hypothetical protein